MTNKSNIFMGIDVSKETLDICVSGKHYKIKNQKNHIIKFINSEIIQKQVKISLCVLESTGSYERLAMQTLQQHSIAVHRAHPNKVYSFAKTINHFAKTDKLDSILLERYAKFIWPEHFGDTVISNEHEELKQLKAIEYDLEMNIQANKNRLEHLDKKAASYIKKQITFAQKQLDKIHTEINKLISNNKELSGKREIIKSFKGVGEKITNVLLINLPELGLINNKEITSLVGLAPKTKESGKKIYKAYISGGRFFVRKALYMGALVACRYNDKIQKFYTRLVNSGKPKKLALTAVMRKIIVTLNSMLKNSSFFA